MSNHHAPLAIAAAALVLAISATEARADAWFFGNETKCMPNEGTAIILTNTYSDPSSDNTTAEGVMDLGQKNGQMIAVCAISKSETIYIRPFLNEPKSNSAVDIFLNDKRVGGASFQNGLTKTTIRRMPTGSYEVKSCVDDGHECKQLVKTVYAEGSSHGR